MFTVAPNTLSPALDLDRYRLAGQHRDVDRRRAVDDHGRRWRSSRPAARRTGRRPAGSRPAPPRRSRAAPSSRPSSSRARSACARPPPGPRLEEPAEQQQRDDHRRRLEVDVRGVAASEGATHRHAALGRAEEDERDDRPPARGQRPERHEGVHRGRAVTQVHERRLVERPTRPQDHGRGEHERHPLPAVEHERAAPSRSAAPGWSARSRRTAGGGCSAAPRPRGRAPPGARRRGTEYPRPLIVASKASVPSGARVVEDGGALGAVVGVGLGDAAESGEPLLDAARARGARHAVDGQVDPPEVTARGGQLRVGHGS